MVEAHETERAGLEILRHHLEKSGRKMEKSNDKSFDLMVDGEYAELKTTAHGWENFDFLSLTNNQMKAVHTGILKRIFLVLNVRNPEKAKIIEFRADDLSKVNPIEIVHYEWNKGSIQHLVNDIEARMTEADLINEFTATRHTPQGFALRVRRISWPLPSRPISRWHTVSVLPESTSASALMEQRRRLLDDSRYFAVCSECNERNPVGWMRGDGICQSCAERNHGVVH